MICLKGESLMNNQLILKRMEETGLVPVVVIENIDDAVPTAKALLAGGIDMMEITFRTACAKDAIAKVKKEVPEMLVGAGTILDVKQAQDAVDAGAEFIVSPGFSEEVVSFGFNVILLYLNESLIFVDMFKLFDCKGNFFFSS